MHCDHPSTFDSSALSLVSFGGIGKFFLREIFRKWVALLKYVSKREKSYPNPGCQGFHIPDSDFKK